MNNHTAASTGNGVTQDPYNKNNYTYSANGTGGVNYFFSGRPITNYNYGKATGADYGAIENKAASDFLSSQRQSLSSAASSGSGSANTDAADLAYLDDQESALRGTLGSADRTLNNGLTQIGDSYDKEVGRATEGQQGALAKYATQREDTTRAKTSALDSASAGSRTLADSVRRRLAQASGANSSVFQQVAPRVIAQDASTKRAGVLDTFGKNFRDIDSAQTDTTNNFNNYLDDLKAQRKEKESGLREGVLTQQQGVNNSLGQIARDRASIKGGDYSALRAASAPYQAAAANARSSIDGLFDKFRTPYQTKTIAATAPTLADYTVDPTTVTQNTTTASGESPYQSFLRKKFADATA